MCTPNDYIHHQALWRILADGSSAPVIDPYVFAPRFAGRLSVTVRRATRLHSTVVMGKMDPYAEVKCNGVKKRTQVHKKGDQTPVWEETLDFDLDGTDSVLRVKVHSKTMLSSNLIGTARIPLATLILMHGLVNAAKPPSSANVDARTFWVEIGRDSKPPAPAGAVQISVAFTFANPNDLAHIVAQSRGEGQPQPFPSSLADVSSESFSATGNRAERSGSISSHELISSISPQLALHAAAEHHGHSHSLSDKRGSLPLHARPSPVTSATHHSRVQSTVSSVPSPTNSNSHINALNSSGKLRLFGGSLSNGIARSKSCVPVIVYVCVQYMRHHGLHVTGLFRVSGSSTIIEAIKAAFESGDSVNISDPHATAAVLKSYFRELAEPLIPPSLFEPFIAATESKDPIITVPKLRDCVNCLPHDNCTVLSYLLHFLTLVAQHESENRMNIRNLAVVWSPNLLRSANSNPDQSTMAREMQRAEECLVQLIQNYDGVFVEGPPKPFQLQHPQRDRPHVAGQRAPSGGRQGERPFAAPTFHH